MARNDVASATRKRPNSDRASTGGTASAKSTKPQKTNRAIGKNASPPVDDRTRELARRSSTLFELAMSFRTAAANGDDSAANLETILMAAAFGSIDVTGTELKSLAQHAARREMSL